MSASCRRGHRVLSRAFRRSLTFDIGAHARPHPRKTNNGEDAYFTLSQSSGAAIGVADGVGGAADSAWYSQALMSNCESILAADPQAMATQSPRSILEMAAENAGTTSSLDGRSTACVLFLDGGSSDTAGCSGTPRLRAANLGDSGFWLLRRRESGRLGVAFKSKPQTWAFNCPYQLGFLHGEQLNAPSDAEASELPLQPDDALVLATDGLFDILFPLEILEIVSSGLRSGHEAPQLARALVDTAIEASKDPMRLSPVIEAMAREGYVARAREAQDDVTAVVALVAGPR